jgi:predicted DNA-binding protein
MRSVTIKLPDHVIERLRRKAETKQLTLDRLLQEMICKTVEDSGENFPLQLDALLKAVPPRKGIGKWSREDAYAERLDRIS